MSYMDDVRDHVLFLLKEKPRRQRELHEALKKRMKGHRHYPPTLSDIKAVLSEFQFEDLRDGYTARVKKDGTGTYHLQRGLV